MTGRFKDKVAIVTGAGSGIGLAVATTLAAEGASVVLVDRDADAVQRAAKDLPRATAVASDVSSEEGTAAYVQVALEQYGTVDLLHSNAGVMSAMRNIADGDPVDFDRVMAINVRGVYLSLRAVLPILIQKQSGAVVVTSSIGAFKSAAGVAPYIASKAASLGLARSAALEVAQHGVRVNAVCPGTTQTHLNADLHAALERGELDQYKDQLQGTSIPLKRTGQPQDIANMVLFLLSDEAAYITGSAHTVDGGFTA